MLYKITLRGNLTELEDAIKWCHAIDIACVTMPNVNLATQVPMRKNTYARMEFIFEDENDATMFLLGFGGELKEISNGR